LRNIAVFASLLLAGIAQAGTALEFVSARLIKVPSERVFDGVVEAVRQSTVSSRISGTIRSVHFDVNDYVEKGEVLVRFRDAEQRARMARSEANLREAKARVAEAEAEYKRIRKVFAKKLVSESVMDKAAAARDAARARLQAAKAAVAEAREQLEYTVVKAPYSGIVTLRHAEVGETVQVGQALLTGLSLDELRVSVEVPQTVVDAVRHHEQAFILPQRNGGDRVKAERLTFFPYADPVAHTFRVRAYLPLGTPELYPGMLVKAAFVTGEESLLLIPDMAVMRRGEVSGIYVPDEKGRLSMRFVRVGRLVGKEMREVVSGLEAGERVALDPLKAALALKKQRAGERP
jgi:RND family efflux transporter MFP subunit